jgi:glycerol uptake facilitator-like aquaporin
LPRTTIARYGDLTVEQARKRTLILAGQVATGGNPIVERQRARMKGVTLAEAFGAFCTIRKALNWFTASTSFANPAVTIARSLTNTFAGIRPLDAPGFIASQLLGAAAAAIADRWLHRLHD